jgi:hypothetical protein
MKSFETLLCEKDGCKPDEFVKKVFWHCLTRHALPFVPLLGGYRSDFFAADRELIESAGRAVQLGQVREEIAAFFMDSGNRGFWRRTANIRLSTTRVTRLSKCYLPRVDTRSPVGDVVME